MDKKHKQATLIYTCCWETDKFTTKKKLLLIAKLLYIGLFNGNSISPPFSCMDLTLFAGSSLKCICTVDLKSLHIHVKIAGIFGCKKK